MKSNAVLLSTLVLASTATTIAYAEDNKAEDPGAAEIQTPQGNAAVSGIIVGSYQTTSQDQVDGHSVHNEGVGQLYLFGEMAMGPGSWSMEVRGGTTPHDNGITSSYGEVNDLVGETLNSNGKGRFAVTQLFYTLPVFKGYLSVGLLDATGLLDANDIADDEYTQFMGTSFVNNPSIEYPSFALGADYQVDVTDHVGYQLFVSSSSGLEDENDPTYGNIFDVGEQGKGVFVGNELQFDLDGVYGSVGLWYNSSDHTEFRDASATDKDNYGAYTSFGGDVGAGQWVAWGGIANDKVSAAANFLAVAYSRPVGDFTFGAGLSRIGDSDDLPGRTDAIKQAELYVRIPVTRDFYVTPDLQYVDNSGFDPDLDDVFVAGLRGGIEF